MKVIKTIAAILIFICSTAQAQDTIEKVKEPVTFKRHEINIGFANIFNRAFPESFFLLYSDYYDFSYMYDYYPYMFQDMDFGLQKFGMGYKFHFRKGALRSYFDIGYNNSDFTDEDKSFSTSSSSSSTYDTKTNGKSAVSSYTARVGYEFHKDVKSTQFFFGLDLFTQGTDYKWEYESRTTYQAGTIRTTKYNNNREYLALGTSPILGVKYSFNDQVSISTETRFNFSSFTEKSNYERDTYEDSSFLPRITNTKGNHKSDGFKIKMSPLGLFSLNVHF